MSKRFLLIFLLLFFSINIAFPQKAESKHTPACDAEFIDAFLTDNRNDSYSLVPIHIVRGNIKSIEMANANLFHFYLTRDKGYTFQAYKSYMVSLITGRSYLDVSIDTNLYTYRLRTNTAIDSMYARGGIKEVLSACTAGYSFDMKNYNIVSVLNILFKEHYKTQRRENETALQYYNCGTDKFELVNLFVPSGSSARDPDVLQQEYVAHITGFPAAAQSFERRRPQGVKQMILQTGMLHASFLQTLKEL